MLKLEAFGDRRASVKGEKDAKDLMRIAAVVARGRRKFASALSAPYLRDKHLELLDLVERGTARRSPWLRATPLWRSACVRSSRRYRLN